MAALFNSSVGYMPAMAVAECELRMDTVDGISSNIVIGFIDHDNTTERQPNTPEKILYVTIKI